MISGGEIKAYVWGIGAGSVFSEPSGPLVLWLPGWGWGGRTAYLELAKLKVWDPIPKPSPSLTQRWDFEEH